MLLYYFLFFSVADISIQNIQVAKFQKTWISQLLYKTFMATCVTQTCRSRNEGKHDLSPFKRKSLNDAVTHRLELLRFT